MTLLFAYSLIGAVITFVVVKVCQSRRDDPYATLKAEAKAAPFWWETEHAPEYVPSERRYTVTRVVDPARECTSRMYVDASGRLFEETHA